MNDAARAYLEQPAVERFETRMPAILKRHAESVAQAQGESLSQYVMHALAERVAVDMAQHVEWRLTVPEQVELLNVLSAPRVSTPALESAAIRARERFGIE